MGEQSPPEPLPLHSHLQPHPHRQIGLQTRYISDIFHVDSESISSLHVLLLQLVFFFFHLLAVLGLCGCVGFYLVAASRGYSLVVVHRLLIAVASLVAEHGLQGTQASAVAAPGL